MFRPVLITLQLLSRRQRLTYLALLGLRVITNILDVIGLLGVGIIGLLLASRLSNDSTVTVAGVELDSSNTNTFLTLLVGFALLFVTKSIVGAVLLRANAFYLARVEASVSNMIARYLFGESLSRLRQYSQSEIQWASTTSVQMAVSQLLSNFASLVAEASLFIMIFLAFAIADPVTSLGVTVYFAVLLVVFQFMINRRLMTAGERMTRSAKNSMAALLDLTKSFRELFVLNKRDFYLQVFSNERLTEAKMFARVRFFDGSPRFFVETALMLGALGLILGQFYFGDLETALPTIALFIMGGIRMMGSLLPLQNAISWLRVQGPQATDAHGLWKLASSSAQTEGLSRTATASQVGGESAELTLPSDRDLVLSNVSFLYPESPVPAVNNISLRIKTGQIVALIGPSGSGKTTLADLMLGVLTPTQGEVSIEGHPPQRYRDLYPQKMAYVPQKPGMLTGTIAQNVAVGLDQSEIDADKVNHVLHAVGLREEILRLGASIDSNLGPQSDNLSGGQLQRLGIARALYFEPTILILDEATSALDASSEAAIGETIRNLRGEVTVVIVAHRLATIQNVDNVFVLNHGSLIGEGRFDDVRREIPLVEEYVRLMSFSDSDRSE